MNVDVLEVAPPVADVASAGLTEAEPAPEVLARAKALLAERSADRAPLGGTRFVVSVSELLAFAEDRLEEARRLCQAFAVAALEERWPKEWRVLFSAGT